MKTTYTICASVEAMKDCCIPVDKLGYDGTEEAVMLAASKQFMDSGTPYWQLLDWDGAWVLPYDYAAVVEVHND